MKINALTIFRLLIVIMTAITLLLIFGGCIKKQTIETIAKKIIIGQQLNAEEADIYSKRKELVDGYVLDLRNEVRAEQEKKKQAVAAKAISQPAIIVGRNNKRGEVEKDVKVDSFSENLKKPIPLIPPIE